VNAVEDNTETDAALKTCFMRGWVKPIENSIPRGKLTQDSKLPKGELFKSIGPFYGLTDSGWSVINRSHHWLLLTVFIAALSLIATIF